MPGGAFVASASQITSRSEPLKAPGEDVRMRAESRMFRGAFSADALRCWALCRKEPEGSERGQYCMHGMSSDKT
jgi:hypothetical protein